jgi:predicted ester cyclase
LLHHGFSNIKIEIHEQVSEGDMVATRKTIHALHSGEIMGYNATGKLTQSIFPFQQREALSRMNS